MKRYLLVCFTALCTSYSVMAQSTVTSEKIIEGVSYEEVAGALSIVSAQGDTYKILRSQIDASIVVDESSRTIELETTSGGTQVQSLDQGVAVLNVNGITILTNSEDTSNDSSYYYSDASPVTTTTPTTSSVYSSTTTTTTYPTTTSSSYVGDDYDYTYDETYSYDNAFQASVLLGGGVMFEDETVTLANVQLRGALRLFSGFSLAVGLSGDAYAFPAYTGFNYDSDTQKYLYMVSGLVGVEVSLFSSLDPSIYPTKIIADFGYGVSVVSKGFKGYSISPGVVWNIVEVNDSSVYTVLSYKYQQFTSDSSGGSLMISVGYKF